MIDIICPTLNRPHLLKPLAENIMQVTRARYRLVFVVDEDDEESRKVARRVRFAQTLVHSGTYPEKINAGVRAGKAPLVLLANDDVVFHRRWFTEANHAFRNGVQVVGPNDLSPSTEGHNNATMPIVRRSYIEDPGGAWGEKGTALHEGYHHQYSETELWQLAEHRGVAKFVPKCIVEHVHPDWGKAEMDETYWRGAYTNQAEDEALFSERRDLWLQQS
jgi:glycosyltransferase involved in cell wall biosynthesis